MNFLDPPTRICLSGRIAKRQSTFVNKTLIIIVIIFGAKKSVNVLGERRPFVFSTHTGREEWCRWGGRVPVRTWFCRCTVGSVFSRGCESEAGFLPREVTASPRSRQERSRRKRSHRRTGAPARRLPGPPRSPDVSSNRALHGVQYGTQKWGCHQMKLYATDPVIILSQALQWKASEKVTRRC